MHILRLLDCLDVLPQLAEWHYGEWRDLMPGETLAGYAAKLRAHARQDGLPIGFVAMGCCEPLGSGSLVVHDLPGREDLSPWLACLYVASGYRGHGIGSLLVRRVMEEAFGQGYEVIYLYTTGVKNEGFYRHLGWAVHERVVFLGKERVIMSATRGR